MNKRKRTNEIDAMRDYMDHLKQKHDTDTQHELTKYMEERDTMTDEEFKIRAMRVLSRLLDNIKDND